MEWAKQYTFYIQNGKIGWQKKCFFSQLFQSFVYIIVTININELLHFISILKYTIYTHTRKANTLNFD